MTLDYRRLRFDTFAGGVPGVNGHGYSVRVSDPETGQYAEAVGKSGLKARDEALRLLEEKLGVQPKA